MSTILQIADAVVAELAAGSFDQELFVERLYVPDFDLEEMDELRVTVVPRELRVSGLNRTQCSYEADIDIAIQKKFKLGSAAEIDPLVELVEAIADFFRLRRLTSFPAVIWSGTEHHVLYSEEHWNQYHQFTSLLTLTFRVDR